MSTHGGKASERRTEATLARAARTTEIDISRHARALRVLRLTDHGLVVVCGTLALKGTVLLLVGESDGDWLSDVLAWGLVAAFAYVAYTGWRHVGVIDASVWRAYLWVLPLLGAAVALIGLGTWQLTADVPVEAFTQQHWQLVGTLVALGPVTMLLLPALMAAWWLGGMRMEPSGLRLAMLLGRLAGRAGERADALPGVSRINTARGVVCAVGGLCVLLLLWVPTPQDPLLQRIVVKLALAVQPLGYFLILRARRHFQVSADALLAVDRRAPILFLRSFDDDEKQSYVRAERALLDFSLETRLANHFHRFGPFVAIGSPRESVPQLGAARVLLPDDAWQQQVLGWMRTASVIVMYGGKTHWVNWELRRVLDSGQATRLILLIPEVKGWLRGKRQRDLDERIAQIRAAFHGSPWQEGLAACTDIATLRALLLRDDGSVLAIRSRSRGRDSYHLAALVAHHVMLEGPALPQRVAAGATAHAAPAAETDTRSQLQPG